MRKVIVVFFLFVFLVYKSFQSCVKFLHKFLIIYYGLFYLLEYLFIYLINNYSIYFFLICKYNIRESYYLNNIYIITEIESKKKVYEKKKYYIPNINRIYYRRYMYFGFTVLYIQIFLRKIKEFKNYVIYSYYYKLKRIYNNLKKKIISSSLLFFFYKNYKLVFFLEKLKKKIFNFIVFFSFCEIYIKMYIAIAILNKLYVLFNNLYLKKNEKN
jgi:hypothetical protein